MVEVATLGFDAEMVYFECEDGETVDGPCGGFGVEGGIGEWSDVGENLHVVVVDLLDEVGTALVAFVDAPLDGKGKDGVDVGWAYEVFKVPLYGVNP